MDRALCFSIFLLSGVYVTYQLQTNVCTSSGRFASPGDETCTKYILCIRVPFTQTFKYYNYTCPAPSLFNPNNSVCTTNYTCKKKLI